MLYFVSWFTSVLLCIFPDSNICFALQRLREHLCTALGNDCKLASGDMLVLDQVWPSLKHKAVVDHAFWSAGAASGHVAKTLGDYKRVSKAVCGMANFVFLQHKQFGAKKELEVNASDLKSWVDTVPVELAPWVSEAVVERVRRTFLAVCEDKQQLLFSAGLGAVADVAKKCQAGADPVFSGQEQQHMLLKIPKAHPLRPLVAMFLEARVFLTNDAKICMKQGDMMQSCCLSFYVVIGSQSQSNDWLWL